MGRPASIPARIRAADSNFFARCTVPDRTTGLACRSPTMLAAGKGLSPFLCRHHCDFKARHGSTWARTFSGAELQPYVASARSYVAAKTGTDRGTDLALLRLRQLLDEAGPTEIVTRLRGMTPDRRARIALARMRQAGVASEVILAKAAAVAAIIAEYATCRTREFFVVQVAKVCHRSRNASGYHRTWEGRALRWSDIGDFDPCVAPLVRASSSRDGAAHCKRV
ncbi:hypothetical protein ACVW1A_005965 [Bradyrhizobium sp. LB1.3]